MNNFSAFHTNFEIKKLSSYILNLQTNTHYLQYTIVDPIRNQCVAINYKNFEEPNLPLFENIQNAIKDDVYLNKHYKAVNFYLAHSKYSLIPEDLFDKKLLPEYMKQIHNVQPTDEVHFTKIDKKNFYISYVYPSILTNFLVNHFPEINLYHSNVPLIRSAFAHTKNNSLDYTGEILIHKNYFDFFITDKEKPLILNSFMYEKPEDIVYFTLFLLNRRQVNPGKIKLYINGLIDVKSSAIEELKKRIASVVLNTEFKFSFPFSNTQLHKWTNLLNF